MPLIKDLWHRYVFTILVLLEAHLSGLRTSRVVKRLCFEGEFRVDAVGFAWVFGYFGTPMYGRCKFFSRKSNWFIWRLVCKEALAGSSPCVLAAAKGP